MGQTSRNAPCPCGSGKKYKKCCLPKEAAARRPQKTYHDYCLEVVDSLRDKILRFMKKARHDRHIEDAFGLYWRTLVPDLEPPKMEPPAYLQFLEWFIHDYPIPPHDRPVIQLFLESQPVLPAEEMQILTDWQDAYISVLQIKEVKPEQGVLAEDIFTGEEAFISDYNLSRNTRKWELITIRKIKVLGEWQASGAGGREPPSAKGEVYDLVMAMFRESRKLHRGLELPDFLRQMGFMLHQRFLTLQARPDKLPRMMTSSGEELTFWEARYDLAGLPEAVSRLESQEDFQESGWEEDDNGQFLQASFSWLEAGKSARKVKNIRSQSGLRVGAFWTPGPGQGSTRVLGNIILEPARLILEVQGEKRFALGKERLESLLSGLIQHRQETVKSPEAMLRDHPPARTLAEAESEIPEETRRAILKDMLDQHYLKWLDTPLPALKGKTPRKATRTKEGLRLLEDLLRTMEYHHQGKMIYDLTWIRKELGL